MEGFSLDNLTRRWSLLNNSNLIRALVFCLASGTALGASAVADDAGLKAYNAGNFSQALGIWKPKAEQGDVVAQFFVGQLFREGKGVPQNFREAAQWYQRAADGGHAGAQNNLGYLYANGMGVPQSNEIAYKWMLLAASAGQPDALKSAEELAKKLSVAELAKTEAALGWMYQNGLKVARQNSQEAARWYLRAALKGQPVAQNNLAEMLSRGEGVSFNPVEAARWYTEAAKQGHYPAQESLGMLYFKGIGVPQDFTWAYAWLYAADQGYTQAMGQADTADKNSTDATKASPAARDLFLIDQQMSEQERAIAANRIGVFYQQGIGIKQDYAAAMKWYKQAASVGYPSAEHNIGLMYQNGFGGEVDLAQAVAWYTKAAIQGHALAQNNLGVLLQRGVQGKQDPEHAVEWFRKAAEQGLAGAEANLGAAYYAGAGIARDYDQALNWFKRAAEQSHPRAFDMLGRMYFLGQGVKQDLVEANKWFSLALELGYEPAKEGFDVTAAKLTAEQAAKVKSQVEAWHKQRNAMRPDSGPTN